VATGGADPERQVELVRALGSRGLRIGVHRVAGFRPGRYRVDLASFCRAAERENGPGVFDVDSGGVVLIDLALLGEVARAFTWDRYEALLRAPVGDLSALQDMTAVVGRPGFAVLSASADSPFSGDGAFRLLADQPRWAEGA
jgi:hypothetical protein